MQAFPNSDACVQNDSALHSLPQERLPLSHLFTLRSTASCDSRMVMQGIAVIVAAHLSGSSLEADASPELFRLRSSIFRDVCVTETNNGNR